jgi:4'-phosphopantetheinyl transferase
LRIVKEAYVKALGGGLSVPLNGFEVSLEPDAACALLSIGGSVDAAACWSMWGPAVPAGFVAALAAEGTELRLCVK